MVLGETSRSKIPIQIIGMAKKKLYLWQWVSVYVLKKGGGGGIEWVNYEGKNGDKSHTDRYRSRVGQKGRQVYPTNLITYPVYT